MRAREWSQMESRKAAVEEVVVLRVGTREDGRQGRRVTVTMHAVVLVTLHASALCAVDKRIVLYPILSSTTSSSSQTRRTKAHKVYSGFEGYNLSL